MKTRMVRTAATAKQRMKRVAAQPRPLALAFPFIDRARELRDHQWEYRQFLSTEYIRIFEDLPHSLLTDTVLYNRIVYELQVRGYKQAGLPVPELVQERYQISIMEEEENRMSPKKAAAKEAAQKGRVYKRKPGIRTLLAELVIENSKNGFTDKRILSELRKRAKKLKVEIGEMPMETWQVQWMRAYVKRNLKKYNLSERQAQLRIRRYDRKGLDITHAHRKNKMRRRPPKKQMKRKMTRAR